MAGCTHWSKSTSKAFSLSKCLFNSWFRSSIFGMNVLYIYAFLLVKCTLCSISHIKSLLLIETFPLPLLLVPFKQKLDTKKRPTLEMEPRLCLCIWRNIVLSHLISLRHWRKPWKVFFYAKWKCISRSLVILNITKSSIQKAQDQRMGTISNRHKMLATTFFTWTCFSATSQYWRKENRHIM